MPLGKGTIRVVDYPPKDFEKITVSTSAVGLDSSKASDAVAVFLTVENANIRYRIDDNSSSVDSSTGHILYDGNNLMLSDPTGKSLTNLKMIREASTDAIVQVTYY